MIDFGVTPAKQEELRRRMEACALREGDLDESFVRSGGKGGQKVNKTASCVYLRHAPTGIEVKCQRSRSRALNRYLARRELCERVDEQVRGRQSARRQEQEKIRRRKRRRSRRAKERMLEQKHRQSEKKELRRNVRPDRD